MKLLRHLSAALRAAAFFAVTASGIVVYALGLPLGRRARRFVTRHWWARGSCRAFGLDCRLTGVVERNAPCLFVVNHLSYFDIVTIGSAVEVSFAAKVEMRRWPLLGNLSRFAETIFISRDPREAKAVVAQIAGHLLRPGNLILFPEGTSWDGSEIRPFKSSPFAIAEDPALRETLRVQPLSIAYIPKKKPELRAPTPFGWATDDSLWGHAWQALGLGGAEVRIVAYEPVAARDFATRKELARHCHSVIEQGYFDSIERPVKKYGAA